MSPYLMCRLLCLLAAAPLAACVTGESLETSDPKAIVFVDEIRRDASEFYASLTATVAPQCSYEQNGNTYDLLGEKASRLRARLGEVGASSTLLQAADAISRTIADARTSHRLASETSADIYGVCMAPGAIALDASALARASDAIGTALGAGNARP